MQDKPCKDHPDAPHGFMRDASHSAGRYVCECESLEPPKREWVGPMGMTMRDYFAAKALPAIYKDTCECARVEGWVEGWRNEVAAEAYAMADAMLKAREA